MLDDGLTNEPDGGDFVPFQRAGASAAGAFRCADCGYGVSVQSGLPRCPMCGGATWEPEAEPARSPLARQLL
jgi:rubredoxin